MKEYTAIYDISVLLGEESIDYPGDTPYSRERLSTLQNGGSFELSKLQLSAHSGTHIDAPAHFIKHRFSRTVNRHNRIRMSLG
jgi:arylformamidase